MVGYRHEFQQKRASQYRKDKTRNWRRRSCFLAWMLSNPAEGAQGRELYRRSRPKLLSAIRGEQLTSTDVKAIEGGCRRCRGRRGPARGGWNARWMRPTEDSSPKHANTHETDEDGKGCRLLTLTLRLSLVWWSAVAFQERDPQVPPSILRYSKMGYKLRWKRQQW